ncbi:type IV toxin-antitoxin system AbiEi family antitoxin domain-containing protein [uncultured Phycicoccus sp.]|uniref:type IV toxin-antitoxin system AbiEi family antitoxin domain-containing protein n=1 Tax=uncultured Phycicoccus sp. TaxID=661422 RepID=UPI0026130B84|nr:type IV toxin-antitoxin system AbiEi family antitoxin domain-containing protein [uncultured Phycicoccus sp.]
MEPALHLVAQQQGGLFTTAQARRVGVGDRALTRLCRDRQVVSLARSVYVLAADWPEHDDARLAVRTRGALTLYPDAAPAGVSTLALRTVPTFGADLARADIVRPVHREILTGLCRIRALHPVVRPCPGAVGSSAAVAGALVQTALDHGHVPAVVAADHALHHRLTTRAEIEAAAAVVRRWPEAGRVRTMLAFVDGRAESVGETRLRLFVRAMGWSVVSQVPVADESGVFAYADLGVEGTNLLLEFDGRVKYASDPEALWREKLREDRVRRQGYVFERVVWSDFDRPVGLTARLHAARARACTVSSGLPPTG